MGFNDGLKVPAHRREKGFVIGEYFRTGTFECCGAMPSGHGGGDSFLLTSFLPSYSLLRYFSTFSFLD